MPEVYLRQLREICHAMVPSPNLGDEALSYSGSATWDRWENHVPAAIFAMWPVLSEETRLAVFLTAESATHYKA